ncbi:MAG: hypothetical protein VXZ82_18815 [Planctomycetota bacterium]|nr:hypothetical protein [Planctomycetota bacterium]
MDPQSQLDKEAAEAEKRERALQFLESMEQRHEDVLDELDALEERIEDVLAEHLGDRFEPLEGRKKRRRKGKTRLLEDSAISVEEPDASAKEAAPEMESETVRLEQNDLDEELTEELTESEEEVAEEESAPDTEELIRNEDLASKE